MLLISIAYNQHDLPKAIQGNGKKIRIMFIIKDSKREAFYENIIHKSVSFSPQDLNAMRAKYFFTVMSITR